MSTPTEKFELREKIERYVKNATTYLRRSSDALFWTEERPIDVRYWSLLDQALTTARDIVEELPDSFFISSEVEDYFGIGAGLDLGDFNSSDQPLEGATRLVAEIRARRERGDLLRRIRALENTTGRTEAEAESYRAKAAELRAQVDGASANGSRA